MIANIVIATAIVCAAVQAAVVDPSLSRKLQTLSTANVIVTMKGGVDAVVNKIQEAHFVSRTMRIESLVEKLTEQAAKSQASVQKVLLQEKFSQIQGVQSFWVSNSVYIPDASKELVDTLAKLDQVAEIHQEHIVPLLPVSIGSVLNSTAANQWGVEKVAADQVWASGNTGEGIIVASTDTGVRGTHESLKNNYVGEYGWYDPYEKSDAPNDGNGHGTHTMGTIAGGLGYGVAPGAKWMSCKGCSTSSCTEAALLGCGQWTVCPHDTQGNNKDCSKAPHLSSNSWGGGQGDTWYAEVVKSWRAANIVPVFAQGNSGPRCGTANSPGDYDNVIGVGASTSSDGLASFSSVGPARGGLMKPDISAPGKDVKSAWFNGDSAYKSISGTSMACPHTAGVVALLLAHDKSLSYDAIYNAITVSASTNLRSPNKDCGNLDDASYPNNMFGHGVIHAVNAIAAASGDLPTPSPSDVPAPGSDAPTPAPSQSNCKTNFWGRCVPNCFVFCGEPCDC